MVKISSAASVMEAYYKLTQSPSQMEEDLKEELAEKAKNQSGETSSLDDLTEVLGAIKDEVQFLNKAKDTFNEIYKILEEAYAYLTSINHKTIEAQSQIALKEKLDGYIQKIDTAVSNIHQTNFSPELIDYIKRLTEIDLNDIHSTLSDHEVQTKSRLLGGIDSSISTTEILDAKSITIIGSRGNLDLTQFTGESAKTLASAISANEDKTGVIVDARNTLSISDLSANGTFTFKITNAKTGSSGHTISGINITDNTDLTPLFDAVNAAYGSTNIRAEINDAKSLVSMIDDTGDNINLTSINEASGAKTFNIFSEYRKSSRDVSLRDVNMNFGSDTERAGGYVEFYGHDKLRPEDITIEKTTSALSTLGAISIVGDQISIGTGNDSSPIGYIHSTIDGEDGARLRIKFYETVFPNGDFEAGNIGDTSLNGWTISNQQVKFGVNQIGGLNSPTDTTYPDPNTARGLTDQSSIDTGRMTPVFTTQLVQDTDTGSKAIKMRSDMWSNDGFAVTRGPYFVSNNPLYLRSGEVVSFDWKAEGGADAYDVYGYLVNSDTNEFVTILDETGSSGTATTSWATESVDITASGNYKFVFASGSYDFSGFKYLGAQLYLDNITITPGPTLAINNETLQKIADKITLHDVNMDLDDQDLNPRVEAAIAPTGASITTKVVGDSRSTSLSSAAGGLNTTHTISVAGIYDTVGESVDTRTVTIAANASAKLISEQLNAQVINTNVGFTAKTGLVISGADGNDTVLFKLSNNNGGTANISADITDATDLGPLKTAINAATGTTGIVASNGVVARNDANEALWTLNDDSLLLTHASGEDIAIAELAGIGLNIQPANYSATTYEDDTTAITLEAARKLIVNPIVSDQRVKITTSANSIESTYRITGTNLSGGAQTENVTVAHNTTGHSTGSFGTVSQVQLINSTSGNTKVGTSSDDDAISNTSPVDLANLPVSGGTAFLDQGEFISITAAANTTATNFTIHGNNAAGTSTTETITSNPGNAISTSNRFTTVTRIAAAGDIAGGEFITIQAGNGTNNGTQFTVYGTNSSGGSINETISSIANTAVATSTRFTSVSRIAAGGDLNGSIIAGIASDTNQLALSQTVSGAGDLTLTSSTTTPGSRSVFAGIASDTDQLASSQSVSSASDLSLTSGTPITFTDGKAITVFTPNDGVIGQYTITGKDKLGSTITEAITGSINNTVTGSNLFMTVTGVSVDSLSPGNVEIGTDRDSDGISTNSAYTGNGTAAINGAYKSGSEAILNTSDYDLEIVGTDREGNSISETVSVINSSAIESTNYFGTVTSISVSGSGTNTGRVQVYSKTAGDSIANSQIPNSGGNLNLTGVNYQNDSGVVVGALQATSNQRFAITSSSNYYSLQNASDELDSAVSTTPVHRDTSPGLKFSTNSNHEVFSTGELFLSSNKSFTVTQQDAAEELKKITITTDSSTPSRNFTVTGTDQFGEALSETITSVTNDTVTGDTSFATVTRITVNADTVGSVQVGTSLDSDIIAQSQRSNAAGSLTINGARTSSGTAGVITLSMAPHSFSDNQTASFTLEGSTFTYTADGNETPAQARDRLLTNPGANEFQGSDNEGITVSSAGVLQVADKNGINLFTIQSDGSADGLRLTESNPDGNFAITKTSGNIPPTAITNVTSSIARRATIIDDGSTFFSNTTNKSEVLLANFSLTHKVADQEFNQRYAHALTDMKGAISTIDYTLFSETETDSADDDLSINAGKYSYSKEQFLEMGLTTSERLKNLTSKTLLIKNIYSQRANLNMLMNGQMFGFALMNFKGDFDLTKK
ncbi:MAG: hypothetical protein VYA61_04695 [Pseudomonadota bacterium]|nr:hypothetical protein [Pseudomonadota bacterium]